MSDLRYYHVMAMLCATIVATQVALPSFVFILVALEGVVMFVRYLVAVYYEEKSVMNAEKIINDMTIHGARGGRLSREKVD